MGHAYGGRQRHRQQRWVGCKHRECGCLVTGCMGQGQVVECRHNGAGRGTGCRGGCKHRECKVAGHMEVGSVVCTWALCVFGEHDMVVRAHK